MNVRENHIVEKLLLVVLTLTLVLGAMPLAAQVRPLNGVPRVFVSPASQETLVGWAGHVDVRVEGVRDLWAVLLRVTYNPAVIDLADASGVAGVQISPGNIFNGLPWHADFNQVDEGAGTIAYQFALDSINEAGVVGDGILARLDYIGVQPGVSPIAMVEVILAKRGGESIARAVEGGQVAVVLAYTAPTPPPFGWASPTPTNTLARPATATPVGGVITDTATPTSTPTSGPSPTPTVPAIPAAPRCVPIIYIDPALQNVSPGLTGWADINLANCDGIYGLWLRVRYNPGVLDILDSLPLGGVQIEPGDIFAGKAWYPLVNDVNGGIITYGAKLSFSEPAGVAGGRVARIRFRAAAMGVSELEVIEVIITDREGVSMDALTQNGRVNVGIPIPPLTATATPASGTATPTPAISPTPRPPLAQLYLQPDAAFLGLGAEATIQVRVRNVTSLYSAQFVIDYNPSVLQILDEQGQGGVQIGYGSFLAADWVAVNQVSPVLGQIRFDVRQVPPTAPHSGEGTIAYFRVRSLMDGATPLAVHDTRLLNPAGVAIDHVASGGLIVVNRQALTGQLTLQGRTQHGGIRILRGSEVLATTAGDGRFVFSSPVPAGEVLNLTAAFPGYLSLAKSLTVPPALIVDLGTAMLPGGDAIGGRVTANRAPGCPGDPTVDMAGLPDGRVNTLDLTYVGSHFGARSTDANWSPSPDGCHPEWVVGRADLNNDGLVNVSDLVLAGNNLGRTSPQPW